MQRWPQSVTKSYCEGTEAYTLLNCKGWGTPVTPAPKDVYDYFFGYVVQASWTSCLPEGCKTDSTSLHRYKHKSPAMQ